MDEPKQEPVNPTVQLGRIVKAAECQPGHASYMSKEQMAQAAKIVLEEFSDELHSAYVTKIDSLYS